MSVHHILCDCLDVLELKLQVGMSCHMAAGNEIWILWKSSQCASTKLSLSLEHSFLALGLSSHFNPQGALHLDRDLFVVVICFLGLMFSWPHHSHNSVHQTERCLGSKNLLLMRGPNSVVFPSQGKLLLCIWVAFHNPLYKN